jgi:hypothetical protein
MVLVMALYLMSGALLLWTVKSAAAAQPKVALADSA